MSASMRRKVPGTRRFHAEPEDRKRVAGVTSHAGAGIRVTYRDLVPCSRLPAPRTQFTGSIPLSTHFIVLGYESIGDAVTCCKPTGLLKFLHLSHFSLASSQVFRELQGLLTRHGRCSRQHLERIRSKRVRSPSSDSCSCLEGIQTNVNIWMRAAPHPTD